MADAQAINFQLLVAQTTLTCDHQRTASPPFNLLSLPYTSYQYVLGPLLSRCIGRCVRPSRCCRSASQNDLSDDIKGGGGAGGLGEESSTFKRAMTKRGKKNHGEKAVQTMFLVREIEEYVRAQLGDSVQEGRWRTSVVKSMTRLHGQTMASLSSTHRLVKQMESSREKVGATTGPPGQAASTHVPPLGSNDRVGEWNSRVGDLEGVCDKLTRATNEWSQNPTLSAALSMKLEDACQKLDTFTATPRSASPDATLQSRMGNLEKRMGGLEGGLEKLTATIESLSANLSANDAAQEPLHSMNAFWAVAAAPPMTPALLPDERGSALLGARGRARRGVSPHVSC